MDDKLTKQDKKFVEKVIETGNLTKSAQEAYDIEDPNYAGVKGQRLIRNDKIQDAIQTLADRIPDELLSAKHLALLNKIDKEGNIDVQAVSKGLEMGYKIKGAFSNEATKPPIILMPVLVKFLNAKDDKTEKEENRN
jgi:phage terminase small subunit